MKQALAKSLLGLFFILTASEILAAETVRVLLGEEFQPLEFSTTYPVHLESGQQQLNLGHPKMNLKISRQGDAWQIRVPGQPVYTLRGEQLQLQSPLLVWKNGNVVFPISVFYKRGRYQLVGHMNIEDYLKGVLPHEMPSSWPLEALKAQAVASRSYALWKAKHQESANYDLRTSILDQMFRMDRAHESLSLPPKVQEALKATHGVALIDVKENVLKAYFHSDCGGATDGARNVWGTDSRQGSIRDVACARRSSEWQSSWSRDRLQQRLNLELVLPGDAQLKDVLVRTQLKSERAEWVDLLFTNGILKRVRGEDIRRMLGYDKIKSTLFAIEKTGASFNFKGRGFGHGVGLCQHGARAMAQAGEDYKTILHHYYPSATLRLPLPPVEVKEANRAVSSL